MREREYDVSVKANGMTEFITHLNSFTNGLSITIERQNINIAVSQD